MTINSVARTSLLVVGWLGVLAFLSPAFDGRYVPERTEHHARVGIPSSPWLRVDWVEDRAAGNVSSSRRSDVTLNSWSWAALAVGVAAFWVRRRFTTGRPAGTG